ncbi:hypothetical protein F2Q70_00005000 [Brassica cretica]|uniref:Uncharacterized protein n=1 Tax=Brassica cretica TaxID=69181 RepID=A0A8S9ISR9_BRACR|nr:hypothetical protein F2Q70_00005000 [Brassica cretica]
MILIFHSFKDFSDLEDFWDDLPVSRLKYNALDDFQEVFQTISSKSSGLLGSLLTKSSSISSGVHACLVVNSIDYVFMSRFFRSGFGYAGFSDLEDFWDDLPVSRLKYNALDDFQKVFQKSSGLLGSVLTKSPFHNRSERFGFSDMDLICRFFLDLEDFWDDLPVSRLKYNALDDFQEVFQTTS